MLYDYIKDMDFAYPLLFGLFAVLPILIWWYSKKYSSQQATINVSTAHSFGVSSWKNKFRHLPFIFRLLAISCIIIALARPQKRNDREQTQGEGIDIVLCMDVSGSMGEKDILPSRMDVAKEVAVDFVKGRPVDRIGIVVFSGESFSLCPITADKNILISQIENLSIRLARGLEVGSGLLRGTVIGEGLATAVDRLSKSQGKSKVIILITDGKEDAPDTRLIDPLTALDIAKSQQVKVYTIGMGAMPSTIVEITGPQKKKNPAIDFIDEALLNKIAIETGGKYFRARDKDGLKAVYKQIDTMEKSKVDVTTFRRYEERFAPFILAALAFLLLEIILRFTVFRRFP